MFTQIRSAVWLMLILCYTCETARILAVVPIPSFSHQMAYRPLWKELSHRGHQVVLLTTDPIKDSTLINLTEIDMHGSYEILTEINFNDIFILSERFSPITMMQNIVDFCMALQTYQYNLQDVQNVIKSGKFDLVIAEYLEPSSLFYGEFFDCPVIAVTSMDAIPLFHKAMGNPTHPLVYPSQDVAYSIPTNFQQRLFQLIFRWIFEYYIIDLTHSSREMLSVLFKRNLPPFEETMKRVQLTFINSNPVFYPTRPLSPATVNVFGMHITKAKPLPQDLQKFLDDATGGAIFVSFGTNVQDRDLSKTNIVEIFLETFSELPYKIIWKLDRNDSFISSNKIMVRRWFPQRDLLEHKNLKLFITQGGIQSMEEAFHCRIPMIGIPFLGDQFNNVLRAQEKQIGLVIYRKDLTKETLKKAILQMIENPRYRKRITELAEIVEDTPMSALETAVWWTEYVLRHKNVPHLKGVTTRVTLNEFYMFDIIFVFILCFITIFALSICIIRVVVKTVIKRYNSYMNKATIKKFS